MILHPHKIIPLLGIQHGMTVLDMGSSVGFWVKPLAQIVGGTGKIIAVDNHSEIIQRLHHDVQELGLVNVHPITGDIHKLSELSLRKNSCDCVLLVRMLSVLDDNKGYVIDQLRHFLKQDGQLIIIDSTHYKTELLSLMDRSTNSVQWHEILEVENRTDGHFFGIVINNQSI